MRVSIKVSSATHAFLACVHINKLSGDNSGTDVSDGRPFPPALILLPVVNPRVPVRERETGPRKRRVPSSTIDFYTRYNMIKLTPANFL